MSSDWIKMRGSLMTHPKVSRIGALLQRGSAELRAMPRYVTRDVTVASLCRVWCATNEHTVDGTWHGVGPEHIDSIAGYEGFAAAMVSVEWLIVDVDKSTLSLPNFLEWNAPAKGGKRSAGAARQATYRERKALRNGDAPRDVTRDVTVTPRVRGRGRDRENPPTPKGSEDGFGSFWLAWPKSERKQDKAKCLEHWKRHGLDKLTDAIVGDVRTKRGTKKWADGYDEAPLTYLRGRRWEDQSGARDSAAELSEWWETAAGAKRKAAEVGFDVWDETIAFPAYLAKLRAHLARATKPAFEALPT